MDAIHSLGEPRLLISRAALLHNARLLRRSLPPGVKLCAIVKSDAYGHGASIVADALANLVDESAVPTVEETLAGDSTNASHNSPKYQSAADQLAVATIEEAAKLPSNVNLPLTILRQVENVFLGRQRDAIEYAIRHGWTLTLASPSAADDVARVAVSSDKRAGVHVMVDTGMTRCGVALPALRALLDRIDSLPSLRLLSIGTHFANSEIAHDNYSKEQLRQFMTATDGYVEARRVAGRPRVLRHAANSGGVFFTPRAHLDMVRPGIALYGIDPTCKPNTDRALRPAMKWTAPLLAVHSVARGATVGYNQTFVASRDMRVGLVPVGYADGYLRALSNKGQMIVGGVPCPVVGRVSMDLTTIDVTNVPHVGVGDEAIVLDSDPLSPASAYVLAMRADTIPYELFTRIGPRVKRVAVDPEDSDIQTADEVFPGDDDEVV